MVAPLRLDALYWIVYPPSMTRFSPATIPDTPPMRWRTAAAISSGCAKRPAGDGKRRIAPSRPGVTFYSVTVDLLWNWETISPCFPVKRVDVPVAV